MVEGTDRADVTRHLPDPQLEGRVTDVIVLPAASECGRAAKIGPLRRHGTPVTGGSGLGTLTALLSLPG